MITADQLLCHAIGDYVLQSDWMATQKTNRVVACLAHVVTYSLPFLFLTQSWRALFFIAGTHFVIDHWRLARYVCWIKNFLGLPPFHAWKDCVATGYHKGRPPFVAVWLMIVTDNIIHAGLNGVALMYL